MENDECEVISLHSVVAIQAFKSFICLTSPWTGLKNNDISKLGMNMFERLRAGIMTPRIPGQGGFQMFDLTYLTLTVNRISFGSIHQHSTTKTWTSFRGLILSLHFELTADSDFSLQFKQPRN